MSKTVEKGKIEMQFAQKLSDFMVLQNQSATLIAEEIKRKEGVKFSAHTIYRWLANKQTITLRNMDYLANHMRRYGVE